MGISRNNFHFSLLQHFSLPHFFCTTIKFQLLRYSAFASALTWPTDFMINASSEKTAWVESSMHHGTTVCTCVRCQIRCNSKIPYKYETETLRTTRWSTCGGICSNWASEATPALKSGSLTAHDTYPVKRQLTITDIVDKPEPLNNGPRSPTSSTKH